MWNKPKIEIKGDLAWRLVKEIGLESGSYFTRNGEHPSDYRAETGYFADIGKDWLVQFIETKDENSNIFQKCYLSLTWKSLGVDDIDEITPEQRKDAQDVVNQVNAILGTNYEVPNEA